MLPSPGAIVKVTNVGTGASFTAATTTDGFYTVKFLIPGTYRVTVSQPGFSTEIVENVLVQTASNPTVNIKLRVGAVAQSVTVMATTSLLEMQRADTGTTLEHAQIDQIPTNAGTITQLYWDTPGVAAIASSRGFGPLSLSGDTEFSINGSDVTNTVIGWQGSPNNELVDGVSVRYDLVNGGYLALNPSQDMADEVKVVALPFSAEYGHTTGGTIIVSTKSGTNRWHGRIEEENEPAGFRANTFTDNYAVPVVPRPPGSLNREVGNLGGPIKKDKLFVFGDFENWYSESNPQFLGSVPTAAMRQGDFTKQYYNSGTAASPVASAEKLYDPFSCAATNASGVCTARNAVGSASDTYLPSTTANVIPYSAWSPVAQTLFPSSNPQKYVPLPSSPGAAIGSTGQYLTMTNNYYPPTNGRSQYRYYMGRMDYNLDPSSRLMLRYRHDIYFGRDPNFYPDPALQVTDDNFPYIRQEDSGAVEFRHTLSPTSVLSFTLGFERYSNYALDAYRSQLTQAQLGFSPTFAAESATDAAVPGIFFTGGNYKGGTAFTGIGVVSDSYNPDQTLQAYGLWSKSMGRHIIKVGAETINERGYNQNGGYTVGYFNFDPEATEMVPLKTTPLGQGDSLASFLLGVGNSMSIAKNVELARQAWNAGA